MVVTPPFYYRNYNKRTVKTIISKISAFCAHFD